MILPFTANALSATTAQVINGTAPYLTFDGGTTKATTVEGLIGIKLSNGKHYISATNTAYPNAIVDTSSPTDAIELPSATDTFASVMTLVPLPAAGNTTYPTIALNNLVNGSYNYWKDDDGDNTPTASGNLTVKWEDANGDITSTVKANPSGTLSACNGPYKLTLLATGGTLSTQYGVPPSSSFASGTHTYHIKPKIVAPYACNAQPNLDYGTGVYAGPANQWDSAKGFKVQDVNTPGSNFPTTGSNYLHFLLTVTNTTAADIIAANGATVSSTSGSGVKLELTNENGGTGNVVRVTLRGPSQATGGGPFTPSTFKIYSDASHMNVVYSFTISRWYIAQLGAAGGYDPATKNFCSGLSDNYRVPTRADYTNSLGNAALGVTTVEDYLSKCPGTGSDNTMPGTNGGLYCTGGNYTRKISKFNSSLPMPSQWEGGLFNEWGNTANTYYKSKDSVASSDWEAYYYWASEAWSSSSQYNVPSNVGGVGYYAPSSPSVRAACVMP